MEPGMFDDSKFLIIVLSCLLFLGSVIGVAVERTRHYDLKSDINCRLIEHHLAKHDENTGEFMIIDATTEYILKGENK